MAVDIDYTKKLEHYWYADLRSALTDLKISEDGIKQVIDTLPITGKDDRNALRRILGTAIGFRFQSGNVVKLNWEFTRAKLKDLGFSEKGVEEMGQEQPLTQLEDRVVLYGVLRKLLVRNESAVPRGYPPHLRRIWKASQGK